MNSKDDGIYVPRRLVFIMIFVSLCVNVFFLLMGILIGKDDLKWQARPEEDPLEIAQVGEEPDPAQSLDDELSMFDGQESGERPPPIPRDALDRSGESRETRTEAPRPETVADPPPPRRDPEPEPPPRETSRPAPQPARPAPTTTGSREAFWIQVMAISDKAKAADYLDKVKAKGFNGTLVAEGAYYKVRVGPYGERGEADRAKDKVNAVMGVKGWVVKK